ncbi:LamG-like jellyroll fold domain-containing protein [Halorhabdus sp. BNX81]|uniref:LamG-like jellyroll fold domain-containing protein n=1 Tax=Halorhabdus sp. BNX81 TaxID=2980181 RepID=UPI0023DD1550|nr:LamG-like jellyroll fold domain-containing protein [Halorhabdus sp. BNX81]WEL21859.1 PKD domain-containing protein [Halorhabdus sp. BNX81]
MNPSDRSQSEVTGVVLMTAVVVILSVAVGGVILTNIDTQDEPVVNLEASVDASNVTIRHLGGTQLPVDEVTVYVRSGGRENHSLRTFQDRQEDSTENFDPGERVTRAHNATDVATVFIVHDPSNTVLYDRTFDVPKIGVSPVTWGQSTDWDVATTESNVVHDSFGDHSADRVELGFSKDATSPLAYWPFDENEGSTAEDIVGNNDGTIVGATPGESGILSTTSYRFNGTSDYVSGATGMPALRNTASLSFWVKTTQDGDNTPWEAPGITGIESEGDGDDIFWGWLNANGQIGIQTGNDAAATSSTNVADDNWHHVVLTRDASSGEVQVYINGTREDTVTSKSGQITTAFDSIGRIEDTGGSPEYFEGRIDELQVYDRVLSDAAIQELSDSASAGSLTTATKTFSEPVDPSTLTLADVNASIPSGTNVSVYVESDPENDGTYVQSDEITLDGSGSHAVTGLSTESQQYRLRVELATSSVTLTPAFDRATLRPT